METETFNITLDKLKEITNLSVRSYNVCDWNELYDLSQILKYYWEHGSFLRLKNCGQKSNDELIGICLNYEEYYSHPQVELLQITQNEIISDPILEKIELLTTRQKLIVNNIIESNFNTLSVRSSNVLIKYLNSDISIKTVKTLLKNQESELKLLRNIGEKSVGEIVIFINTIRDTIELVSLIENEQELTIELFYAFLNRKFTLDQSIFIQISENYDFSKGIPLFKTLKILTNHNIIFDNREKEIFNTHFNYFSDFTTTVLDEIAENLNITRERARQLRVKIYDNICNTFEFIKELEYDTLNLYGIDFSTDFIIIDDNLCNEINKTENTSYNKLFINKILSILFKSQYDLIGNEENIIVNKNTRLSHNWNSTYLISRNIVEQFDFEALINDISQRINQRIDESYSFHFLTYIYDFKRQESLNSIENILQIAEFLIFSEFSISISIDDSIVFPKNTKKQIIEYVYEILEEKKEPLNVYDIYKFIEHKYPIILPKIRTGIISVNL